MRYNREFYFSQYKGATKQECVDNFKILFFAVSWKCQ